MKKVIIAGVTLFWSFFAFAATPEVDPLVLKAFQGEFRGAQEVKWKTTNGYYEAAFTFNGQHITAIYQSDGKLLGLSKNISPLELPIRLQTRLKNKYSPYWITDLFELSNDEGTTYYVTVENGDIKLVLKSIGTTGWTFVKKSEK